MPDRATVREVKKLFLRYPDFELKPSQRAWILKDMLKNAKSSNIVYSRRAERMMRQKIRELEKDARWENFPEGNI